MASNEPVRVEQRDRLAAQAMLEHAFRNAPTNCCDDVNFFEIAEHFARHRTLSQADGRREGLSADWVAVPREPTDAMESAGNLAMQEQESWLGRAPGAVWSAMLAAVPALTEVHQEKNDD